MVEEAASKVYAQLEAQLGDRGDCDALRIMLEDSPCIWAGRGFVRADRAVLHLDQDCAPYLHRVPDITARSKQLMRLLGVSPCPCLLSIHALCSMYRNCFLL